MSAMKISGHPRKNTRVMGDLIRGQKRCSGLWNSYY